MRMRGRTRGRARVCGGARGGALDGDREGEEDEDQAHTPIVAEIQPTGISSPGVRGEKSAMGREDLSPVGRFAPEVDLR